MCDVIIFSANQHPTANNPTVAGRQRRIVVSDRIAQKPICA